MEGHTTMTVKEGGLRWRAETFDSLDAAVQFADKMPSIWTNCVSRGDDVQFTGTESWEEAKRQATIGWPEGRERMVNDLDAASVLQLPVNHRALSLDVAGTRPFVPAAVAGDPLCMVRAGLDSSATRPVFRLLVSISALEFVPAGVLQNRGAAILSWVDKLEAEGARCEVVALRATKVASGHAINAYAATVMLKRADEPLDIDRLAFGLVSPSMLRRVMFGCMERHDDLKDGFKLSYGVSFNECPSALRDKHSIYFPAMTTREQVEAFGKPAKAVAEVERIISEGMLRTDIAQDEA